jgi:hypothetical protein
MGEEASGLIVSLCRRHDRDVQSLDTIDVVVIDLRENDLLLDSEGVVATAIEGLGRNPTEIAYAR